MTTTHFTQETTNALTWARCIRNKAKRAYAMAIIERSKAIGYDDALNDETIVPACSYLAAQAVRMTIRAIFERAAR